MAALQMKQWLAANGRKHVLPTDGWYLRFASQLWPVLAHSDLARRMPAPFNADTVAIRLAQYFQDAIAQRGGWTGFTQAYRRLYDRLLPFYSDEPDYVADEINRADVCLVLWTSLSRPASRRPDDYTLVNPHDETLLQLAGEVYARMDEAFGQAPVSDVPASPSHWVMGADCLSVAATPLPSHLPAEVTSRNAARCLAHSGGRPLLFFADYPALCRFFVQVLGWEDQPSALLPDLAGRSGFVVYANAKGMLLAHDVAFCFADSANPLYDPQRAVLQAYRLWCEPGLCPFDLLKYGMANGLLPDAAFPFENGRQTLQDNGDFVARYYLRDYYEGD